MLKLKQKIKLKGIIEYKDISWTKKDFKDLFRVGDIIYVKKIKKILVFNNFQKLMVVLLLWIHLLEEF